MGEGGPVRLLRRFSHIGRSKRGGFIAAGLALLVGAGCGVDIVGQQGPMVDGPAPPGTSPAQESLSTASQAVGLATDTDPVLADPTDTAAATFTPAIDSSSTAAPDAPVCRRPSDDYRRVQIQGETLNRRTEEMLETAMEIYTGPADLKRIAQGSYTDALEASFGTHAGGGAVDISIRNPAEPAQRLFDEVPAMIRALRQAGFAAWYRETDEVYPGSVPHIHAVAIGDAELSAAAQLQLTGPAGYFRGFNGLPVDPPVPDGAGGPVVCSWMAGFTGADDGADAGTDADTDADGDPEGG
jgi:hypothetical protein